MHPTSGGEGLPSVAWAGVGGWGERSITDVLPVSLRKFSKELNHGKYPAFDVLNMKKQQSRVGHPSTVVPDPRSQTSVSPCPVRNWAAQ